MSFDTPPRALEPIRGRNISPDTTLAIASAQDLDIKTPCMSQVFVDIDTPSELNKFYEMIPKMAEFFAFEIFYTYSRNGKLHFYIDLAGQSKHMNVAVSIAFSALFGSDITYTACCIKRLLEGQDRPIIFFERKNTPIYRLDMDNKPKLKGLLGDLADERVLTL